MSEALVVISVPPVCPNPSAHKHPSRWRKCIDYIATAALLIWIGLFAWSLLGIRLHRIAIATGDNGDAFGVVELPELIGPYTTIVEFSAIRVPSRIIAAGPWFRWPVPEVMEVTVRVRDAAGSEQAWNKTYLLACDDEGACKPLSALKGVILLGCDEDGRLQARKDGWVYFPEARPEQEQALPGPPSPEVLPSPEPSITPSPKPQKLERGVTVARLSDPVHKAGSSLFEGW